MSGDGCPDLPTMWLPTPQCTARFLPMRGACRSAGDCARMDTSVASGARMPARLLFRPLSCDPLRAREPGYNLAGCARCRGAVAWRTELREELNGAGAARGEAAGGLAVRRPLRGARRLPDVGRQRVPRA